MSQLHAAERGYFTDLSVLKDPYDYFRQMYQISPVHQLCVCRHQKCQQIAARHFVAMLFQLCRNVIASRLER